MYPVIHVIDTLSTGGAQRLLTILASSPAICPAVLDLRGHSSAMADEIARAGVRIESAGLQRPLSPRDWWRVWRALRRLPSRLVHLHLTDSVMIGAPLARLMGRRVVVTVHNTRTVPDRNLRARLRWRLETLALRRFTDHVILVGANVATANAERLRGVAQTVLPNVIRRPAPADPEARRRLRAAMGAAETDIVFIATGRLHPQKDHDTLLAAFARTLAGIPQARLWILGDGGDRGRLEAVARTLGLGPACRFLGPQDDVAAHLAAADVFVMSSAWEGLPLGLLEAMAAGLPVVATAVGDLPSTLGDACGLLVPPKDPEALAAGMAALAADPAMRADQARRSAEVIAPFLDAEGWLERTAAIYRGVLDRTADR